MLFPVRSAILDPVPVTVMYSIGHKIHSLIHSSTFSTLAMVHHCSPDLMCHNRLHGGEGKSLHSFSTIIFMLSVYDMREQMHLKHLTFRVLNGPLVWILLPISLWSNAIVHSMASPNSFSEHFYQFIIPSFESQTEWNAHFCCKCDAFRMWSFVFLYISVASFEW